MSVVVGLGCSVESFGCHGGPRCAEVRDESFPWFVVDKSVFEGSDEELVAFAVRVFVWCILLSHYC